MKKVTKIQVIDHGIDHEQYFQGCGVAFTEFDVCFTGIGDSAQEALNDALDQASTSYGCDFKMPNITGTDGLVPEDSDGLHYYVSILLKLGEQ